MLDDKAKELGRLIGQSAEYQAVKRANTIFPAKPATQPVDQNKASRVTFPKK